LSFGDDSQKLIQLPGKKLDQNDLA
jgi:hypothetical protein